MRDSQIESRGALDRLQIILTEALNRTSSEIISTVVASYPNVKKIGLAIRRELDRKLGPIMEKFHSEQADESESANLMSNFHIMDKLEYYNKEVSDIIDKLEDRVLSKIARSEEQFLVAQAGVKQDIYSKSEENKDDIIGAIGKLDNRLWLEYKDIKDELIKEFNFFAEKVQSNLLEFNQKVLDTVIACKDEVLESQEKLIGKYTNRIIAQIFVILGVIVGVIENYSVLKEQVGNFLTRYFPKSNLF